MAEDEEGPAPARPGSRGPRVVTGDMKRAASASRVVTGQGVAPPPRPPPTTAPPTTSPPRRWWRRGQAAPPPPPPPRRPAAPRGDRSRDRGRRPARADRPEPEPDAEPEPWTPITVTRNIPPSVHRGASPSAPAPPPWRQPGQGPQAAQAGQAPEGAPGGRLEVGRGHRPRPRRRLPGDGRHPRHPRPHPGRAGQAAGRPPAARSPPPASSPCSAWWPGWRWPAS